MCERSIIMSECQLGVSISVGIFSVINNPIYFVPVIKYRLLLAGKSSVRITEVYLI